MRGDRVVVRRLVPGDARAYREFRLDALARDSTAFTSTPEEERVKPLSWSEARISSKGAPDDFIIGAFADGCLIGTAGFSRGVPRQARHKGVMFGVAVAPEATGGGVGKRLVWQLLHQARSIPGLRRVTLTYTEGNVAAERLYRACGFEVFGRETLAVQVGDVAITKVHMARSLDDDELGPIRSLDGVRMAAARTDVTGAVGPDDCFHFEQVGNVVSARYRGGVVADGYLVGHRHGGKLQFRYVQADLHGGLDAGVSDARIEALDDGRLRIVEDFTWLTRPGRGTNVFEEVAGRREHTTCT